MVTHGGRLGTGASQLVDDLVDGLVGDLVADPVDGLVADLAEELTRIS